MVGLVIVTFFRIEEKCSAHGVLCQVRAKWNSEKEKPETYPGCLQVACHGQVEEGESFYQALMRESTEELGSVFTEACKKDIKLIPLIYDDNEKREVLTFGAFIPRERLKMIQKGKDVADLKYLTEDEVKEIINATDEMSISGPPKGKNAMFADEISAHKAGLRLLATGKNLYLP